MDGRGMGLVVVRVVVDVVAVVRVRAREGGSFVAVLLEAHKETL